MSQVAAFVGSVPKTYHTFLGPLLFEPYAKDLVSRVKLKPGDGVLELAAGTGIVTKMLAAALPEGATITATDLKEPMLAVAKSHVGADPRVTFQETDACSIPFADNSFDWIVTQYGVMFFPDKVKAMKEARRVLKKGGTYVFNVWDSLDHNPIPRTVHETVAAMFPAGSHPLGPPTFLKSTPYGYFDPAEIERVCRAGGFTSVKHEHVSFPSSAPTAEDAARAAIEGTPLLAQLQERGVTDVTPYRQAAAAALAKAIGDKPCKSTMRAVVFTVA